MKAQLGHGTRRLVGDHVTGIMVQSDNHRFVVDPEDQGVGRHLRLRGYYGFDELERIRPLLRPDSDVLVVGAHIGTLAIPLADCARSVTAIEANPASFDLLTTNIALNAVQNISVHQVAASDCRGTLSFVANRANSGGSKVQPINDHYRYRYDHPTQIEVEGMRLDDLLVDRQYDLVVMDIEGSEHRALLGMPKLLSKAHHLVVEFVPHHLRDVASITVEQFLAPLAGFETLHVPSIDLSTENSEFAATLNRLYSEDRSDDGLIFSRLA